MRRIRWAVLVLLLGLPVAEARAQGWRKGGNDLELINKKLEGKIVDHTANSSKDHRIWSRTLWERRDLYVYLPPHYDPQQRYPFMIWFHGFNEDEQSFARHFAPVLDEAIRSGKLPPLIVAAPDGSFKGEPDPFYAGSFFLNTSAGDFEDMVLQDVWDFVCRHYPIRQEREAHILAGWGMGGFAAYNYGIKHRDAFGTVIGIMPPLNLRWMNKKGNAHAPFDPRDWAWRMDLGPGGEVLAFMDRGHIVKVKHWYEPLYGVGMGPIPEIAMQNPIEMIDRLQLCPGQLEMYVGYSGQDEYSIAAQVESFLYMAKWRGLNVGVGFRPLGRHNPLTAAKLLPDALAWLAPRLAAFSPLTGAECGACGPVAAAPAAPPHATRRLFRPRAYRTHDDSATGYPHTLPDPIP